MNKMLIINNCGQCPFFDNEYYTYNQTCMDLNEENEDYRSTTLDNCPLKTAYSDDNE